MKVRLILLLLHLLLDNMGLVSMSNTVEFDGNIGKQ